MGLFLSKKERAEKRGYQAIVKQKTTLAARQAYADEAVKVARERARAQARAPTFGQRLASFAMKKISAPAQRAPVRRAPTRRVAPRRTVRRYAPARRAPAPRSMIPQAPRVPSNLNQAIYGGY